MGEGHAQDVQSVFGVFMKAIDACVSDMKTHRTQVNFEGNEIRKGSANSQIWELQEMESVWSRD